MPTEGTTPVYLEYGDGARRGHRPQQHWLKWREKSMSRKAAEGMKSMPEKRYPEWTFRITEVRR